MSQWLWFFLTLAIATVGGLVLTKLKVPAGTIMGALLCVGILNIITGKMYMPSEAKIVTKAVAGLFIGMNVTMETVRNLKKLFKPTIMLVVLIISLCLCMGIALFYVAGLDVVTSLFSVAPGGMTDMTLMTMDMGGDSAVVAVIQVMRLLTVYCISMPLVKVISKKMDNEAQENAGPKEKKQELDKETKKKRIIFSAVMTVIGGTVGQILAKLADFSVLVLICTMVLCAAINIKTGKLYMPKKVRRFTQILSGALIGTNMTYESLINLKAALVPALIICCGFVCINIIIAIILSKTCKMSLATAMLSSSAGGATESALVAMDFGADPAIVSVLQISRMVCTTAFYPIVVAFVAPLL